MEECTANVRRWLKNSGDIDEIFTDQPGGKIRYILTPEQIALYNKLRGYSSDDPCENIPEGHDPEM